MRKIIIPIIFLVILTLSFDKLDVSAQRSSYTIVLNPGATNSDSQNPILPANVTVPVGANVTWINKDSSPHMLVSGTPDEGPNNIFYGDYFDTDENYTVTFDEPGTYSYYDPGWIHIRGLITVENPIFSSGVESTLNNSGIRGIDHKRVLDSNLSDVNNTDRNITNSLENGSFLLPSSSFITSFSSSITNDLGNSSSAPSLLSSNQALKNIISKVGPLVGLLMSGGSSFSSSSPSSSPFPSNSSLSASFAQSNESLGMGDFNNHSSVPSSATPSSSPNQALKNIISKVGPLVGLLMSGGSSFSSSSPSSSSSLSPSLLSQSGGLSEEGLTKAANITDGKDNDKLLSAENSISLLNHTSITQDKSIALEKEREKVQEQLINVLRKAYSIGAELPELPTTLAEGENATIFIKVNVINPIDKRANTSDFPIKINYEYGDGVAGARYTYVNDAGRIEAFPASIYAIIAQASKTNDQTKDSFLNSYSTLYSKGCSGHIDYMETKDCVITKKFTNMTNNIDIRSGNS